MAETTNPAARGPLMAIYWTVSGPVEVHTGREWSLFSWRDRCAEAAGSASRASGLWHADVSHQLETHHARRDGRSLSTTPA